MSMHSFGWYHESTSAHALTPKALFLETPLGWSTIHLVSFFLNFLEHYIIVAMFIATQYFARAFRKKTLQKLT